MIEYFVLFVLLLITFKLHQKLKCGKFNSDVKMTNKVVIVTGSNTGIGFATAEDLARRGAKVILACRNEQKGTEAKNKIIQSTGNNNIFFKQLDLTSFKSVRDFAADIIKTEPKLDVLINNAGVSNVDNSLTIDKLPIEAQVNHFSPFLLTKLLLPVLKSSAPSRIVNVSSVMHYLGTTDNLDKQAKNWLQHRIVYCNTKLANILFTRKLSENFNGTGVTVNCLHPGVVYTDIFRHEPGFVKFIIGLLFKTVEEGAQTSIYLAVDPKLNTVTGKYFSDCCETRPSSKAEDDEAATRLWEISEIIIKQKNIE